MSTRCQVIVADEFGNFHDAAIYRHGDGYPDTENGVLATLLPACKAFRAARGFHQPDYLLAHILAAFLIDHYKTADKSPVGEEFRYLGYGIEGFDGKFFHGDVEYIYVVRPDRVDVHKTNDKFGDDSVLDNSELVQIKSYGAKRRAKVS